MSNILYATGSLILLGTAVSSGNFALALASVCFLTGALVALIKGLKP